MLPTAVEIGITIKEYWNMTLGEIMIYFKCYKKQKEKETQDKLYLSYQTALFTANFVANNLNGKQNPSFYELFPDYQTESYREEIRRQQIEAYQAQMQAWAISHNKQRR